MPKKTRAEKLAAQLRRLKMQASFSGQQPTEKVIQPQVIENKSEQPQQPSIEAKPIINIQEVINKKETPKGSESQRYNYSYVKGDLRKIITLASLAVTIEVGLNLTLRTGFAKLILRTFGIEI
jgi:hypothetical protein